MISISLYIMLLFFILKAILSTGEKKIAQFFSSLFFLLLSVTERLGAYTKKRKECLLNGQGSMVAMGVRFADGLIQLKVPCFFVIIVVKEFIRTASFSLDHESYRS